MIYLEDKIIVINSLAVRPWRSRSENKTRFSPSAQGIYYVYQGSSFKWVAFVVELWRGEKIICLFIYEGKVKLISTGHTNIGIRLH